MTDRRTEIMILTYEFLANWLRARFADSERGASLVEYALLVALIAVVCIAAVTILGKNASNKFSSVGTSIG
ncbi:MAG: Flp family type IVb pilin [Acidimicrobiales bacterium]|nr:Flp family type IVb pilin [Acidimicrobiales bacterium]